MPVSPATGPGDQAAFLVQARKLYVASKFKSSLVHFKMVSSKIAYNTIGTTLPHYSMPSLTSLILGIGQVQLQQGHGHRSQEDGHQSQGDFDPHLSLQRP